jgi:uncharacterized protein (DUF362 family)
MDSHNRNSRQAVTRRAWLRWLALGSAGAALAACDSRTSPTAGQDAAPTGQAAATTGPTQPINTQAPAADTAVPTLAPNTPEPVNPPTGGQPHLVVSRGEDPAAITERALTALGGMERFVKQGYDVIIKPNICTDYYPFEYAATTNPVVVATLVKLALGAGARRVRVMDYPFGGTGERAYAKSGIADAVAEAGGEMEVMNPNKFRKTDIPNGQDITAWEIYQEVLKADLLINVPIAKHHSLARLTLGGKNLMGLVLNRGGLHYRMGPRMADLLSLIRPSLTVVDAVRILMANGPTGGNLNDVKLENTIIASHDIVAADAYAATLFGLKGEDISYIQSAAERGLGTLDLQSIKLEEVSA